jgi:hypothetical protein
VDTSRFQNPFDRFPVLDVFATFAFKTGTSVSFELGRFSDTLRLPGGAFGDDFSFKVGMCGVFRIVGRVDVHHPCEGHIKAQLHVVLPAEYHETERMERLVAEIFAALAIPADETFEALFVSPSQQTSCENATDREGMSDRIY